MNRRRAKLRSLHPPRFFLAIRQTLGANIFWGQSLPSRRGAKNAVDSEDSSPAARGFSALSARTAGSSLRFAISHFAACAAVRLCRGRRCQRRLSLGSTAADCHHRALKPFADSAQTVQSADASCVGYDSAKLRTSCRRRATSNAARRTACSQIGVCERLPGCLGAGDRRSNCQRTSTGIQLIIAAARRFVFDSPAHRRTYFCLANHPRDIPCHQSHAAAGVFADGKSRSPCFVSQATCLSLQTGFSCGCHHLRVHAELSEPWVGLKSVVPHWAEFPPARYMYVSILYCSSKVNGVATARFTRFPLHSFEWSRYGETLHQKLLRLGPRQATIAAHRRSQPVPFPVRRHRR